MGDTPNEKPPARTRKAAADTNTETIAEVIKRVSEEETTDRALVHAALLNTFMSAVRHIGGRAHMTAADYKAFGVAMVAIDSIQPAAVDYSSGRGGAEGLSAVARELGETGGQG